MTDSTVPVKSHYALLVRIGDALRIPVESFSDEGPSTSWDDLSELLGAYASITNVQGRRRVLAFALAEAARSTGPTPEDASSA